MTIAITELGSICVDLRTRNIALFEQLGSWVTSTSDSGLQRLFATACHRHAWHAELWEQRTPVITGIDFGVGDSRGSANLTDDGERRAWYLDQLDDIDSRLTQLAAEVDAELDPSTARTVQLVAADIADLQSRHQPV